MRISEGSAKVSETRADGAVFVVAEPDIGAVVVRSVVECMRATVLSRVPGAPCLLLAFSSICTLNLPKMASCTF